MQSTSSAVAPAGAAAELLLFLRRSFPQFECRKPFYYDLFISDDVLKMSKLEHQLHYPKYIYKNTNTYKYTNTYRNTMHDQNNGGDDERWRSRRKSVVDSRTDRLTLINI